MRNAQPDDWNTEPLPAAVAIIPLDRRFTPEEMRRIGAGLVVTVHLHKAPYFGRLCK
jgi:hypothetical protein